jgi:hypothetical protein
MQDLIYRQEAIDAMRQYSYFNDFDVSVIDEDIAVIALKDLPSAQPEIIHCADCKWFQCNMRPDGYLPKGVEEYECRHWCGWCDPVDFCSYAERRNNE